MLLSHAEAVARIRERLQSVTIAGESGAENFPLKNGLLMALRLLETRERGDASKLLQRLGALRDLLDRLQLGDANDANRARALVERIDAFHSGSSSTSFETADALLHEAQLEFEQLLALASLSSANISGLTDWEIAHLAGQIDSGSQSTHAPRASLTAPQLECYLRERTHDPALVITAFLPLAGGLGKETVRFATRGACFTGEFVLRRDHAVNLLDIDCHRIESEYPLLRALHAHGLPVPNVRWLQTSNATLPGPDFILMDCITGVTGGSVFGAKEEIDRTAMSEQLGTLLAQLHTLPPLDELGELTESIAPELWRLPLADCVGRYIEQYRRYVMNAPHQPSIAVAGLFNWLMRNVPAMVGRPCLVHGDFGAHNMLFENGRVTGLLDWEYAHVGDPAEDLAYLRNAMGRSLDWARLMAAYIKGGGTAVSEARLHFFQVWAHARNAAGGCIVYEKFMRGELIDPVLTLIPYEYRPLFLGAARALITTEEQ